MKKSLCRLGKKMIFTLVILVFGFASSVFADQVKSGDSLRIKNIKTGQYLTPDGNGIFGRKQPSDKSAFKIEAGANGLVKLIASDGRYVGRSGDTYVIYAKKRQLLGLSQNPSQFKISSSNYGDVIDLQEGSENVRMNVDIYTHPKGREVFFAGDDWRMSPLAKKWTKEFVFEFVSRPAVVTKPKAPVVVPTTPDKPKAPVVVPTTPDKPKAPVVVPTIPDTPIVIAPEPTSQNLGKNLLNAAENNDLSSVKKLLQQGADVNYVRYDGMTSLHFAVLNQNLDMVELLVNKGAFVNLPDIIGKTALSEAQDLGNKKIIDLVKAGKMFEAAKPEVPSEGGMEQDLKFRREWRKNQPREKKVSWLFKAIFDGNLTQLKDWLDAGADINGFDNKSGKAPLHVAIEKGDFDIVKYLVENKADVNLKTELGESPLGLAEQGKNKQIIDFLKTKGALLAKAEKPIEMYQNLDINDLKKIYPNLEDPISHKVFKVGDTACALSCDSRHIFRLGTENGIEKWLKDNKTCPLCRANNVRIQAVYVISEPKK